MIRVQALGDNSAEITIYDTIGKGFFEEGITAETVLTDLNALGDVEDIDVRINSPGGNVWDGIAIYNLLTSHPAKVHVFVDGVAASIASVVAMAGDQITMGQGATMMIHSPRALFSGTAEEMRDFAETLDTAESGMADIYKTRSGKTQKKIMATMKAETWFTAREAVDAGFADDLIKAKKPAKPQASWQAVMACFKNIPESFITPQKPAVQQSAPSGAKPKEAIMSKQVPASAQPDENKAAEITAAAEKAAEEARTAERTRVSEITAICTKFDLTGEFMAKAIKDGTSKTDVNDLILDRLADKTDGGTIGHPELTEDEHDKLRAQASDWLVSRAGLGKHDQANPFKGMSFEGIARACLEASGVNCRRMGRMDIINAAITHSTSDFPNIFENALHKSMIGGFEAAAPTWPRFCRTTGLSDFRAHLRYRMGSFSDLSTVLESGEYQDGTFTDADRESITAVSKGRILNVSREMLKNDDMGVFSDVAVWLGQAAARTLDKDVFAMFALNSANGPTMGDSDPLWHANHSNIAGTGVAPTMAAFEAARVQMTSQQDPGTNDYVGAVPAIWLGPPSLRGQATQTNEGQYDDEATKNQNRPNISRGMVRDIVDTPRLPATIWYVLADPSIDPVFEVGFVDGIQVPQLAIEESFRSNGLAWRISYDYGVAAVGWRGIIKNPGT